MIKNTILVATGLVFGLTSFAQTKEVPKHANWYNGNGSGMQTEKAYKKVKKMTTTTVLVAVIDSGVDIEHEDLKGKIWVNPKEIAGNGIDDDNNGYIDDIHGWNFLGNASGENVNDCTLEMTRIVRDWGSKYEGVDRASLSVEEQANYDTYMSAKADVNKDLTRYTQILQYYDMMPRIMAAVPGQVEEKLGKKDYTMKDLKKWKVDEEDQELMQLKGMAMAILSGELTEESINKSKKQLQGMVDYNLNVDFDERKIIGDDPNDFSDTKYGNGDVEGPDAGHGTHVSGIITANRNNGLGGDGVATDVKIMSLRAVPNGDEADKDIALAIRYAVDNGAQIINMSFGKSYSPHQKEVAAAFEYAASKGVLCIHAAGNDGRNLDEKNNYPTNQYAFQATPAELFMTIGASTYNKKDQKKSLPASFSNYSATKVDVFAPGFQIYSTVPQSDYDTYNGTSMACPATAGAAAFLKSYFSKLSMAEIQTVLLTTAKSYKGKTMQRPGDSEEVDFASLSVTGSVINLKNAVKACKAIYKVKGY